MKHYIIPIFIPHYGCVHQCVFCDQRAITGQRNPVTAALVTEVINTHLARITEQRRIEVAFYGGSFTALPLSTQRILLKAAYEKLQAGQIHAIRLSTRPDSITPSIISLLREYCVSTVELGVQSFDDAVLMASLRGHGADEAAAALSLLRSARIRCGFQLMVGLPGENWDSLLYTAAMAQKLAPDFARIYPVIILAGTRLATMYYDGSYQPLSLEEAVSRSAYLKWVFETHNIDVIRVGLQATEELSRAGTVLAGPYHPAFGEMVDAYLFFLMVSYVLESLSSVTGPVVIRHHPRDHSKVRGISGANVRRWQAAFGVTVKILSDAVRQGELVIEHNQSKYLINKSMLFHV